MCYQVAYTLQCEHVLTDIIFCNDATSEVSGAGDGNCYDDFGNNSTYYNYHGGSGNKSKPPHVSSTSKVKGQYAKSTNGSHYSTGSSSLSSSRTRQPVKGQGYNHHSNHRRHHGHHPNDYEYHQSSRAMLPPPLPTSTTSTPASASPTTTTTNKRPCANLSVQAMPYPTPPSFAADPASFYSSSSPISPRCPLRDCPFEQKQRCWNCCWCGKSWNITGRCGCVMLIEGNQVRCEHICCEQCEPASSSSSSSGAGGTGGGGGAAVTGATAVGGTAATSMAGLAAVSSISGVESDPGGGSGGYYGSGNNSNSNSSSSNSAGYDRYGASSSSPWAAGHSGIKGLYY